LLVDLGADEELQILLFCTCGLCRCWWPFYNWCWGCCL